MRVLPFILFLFKKYISLFLFFVAYVPNWHETGDAQLFSIGFSIVWCAETSRKGSESNSAITLCLEIGHCQEFCYQQLAKRRRSSAGVALKNLFFKK
jgi:hypothetical protein